MAHVPAKPKFFEVKSKDIVSHDPQLSSDGEALCRFILTQSRSLPYMRINFHGSHSETKSRWVTDRTIVTEDGQEVPQTRMESFSETVTDFDFCVDVHPSHLITSDAAGADRVSYIQWSVGDDEPAYRGRLVREYDTARPARAAKPSAEQVRRYEAWIEQRKEMGYPPWLREDELWSFNVPAIGTTRSSKTLREWADEHCASELYLKEFVFQKVLYGWDLPALKQSLQTLITSTPYTGTLSISFTQYNSRIYIRPDNWGSYLLSKRSQMPAILKFVLELLCILNVIWLFKRFHAKGGGKWEVCGAAYPLKRVEQWDVNTDGGGEGEGYAPLDEPTVRDPPARIRNTATRLMPSWRGDAAYPTPPSHAAVERMYRRPFSSATSNPGPSHAYARIISTPTGPQKVFGLREGEWFRMWEGVITRAVVGRHQSPAPLESEWVGMEGPNVELDGYEL